MVKRSGKAPDTEPEGSGNFKLPSEKEHLFQVVDVYDETYESNKFNLDRDTVIAKLEVVGGEEEGLSLLNRCVIDFDGKGFWATRLFLKAIGEPCRDEFEIDTENWIGRQFYATVVHNKGKNEKTYANIKEYNFEKLVDQHYISPTPDPEVNKEKEIAWDDEK